MNAPTVYLDYAASTPLENIAFEAMRPYLCEFHGNPSSIHGPGRKLRTAVENARKSIADLLGCSPGEIIFTSGGTEANNMVLQKATCANHIQRIITSPLEHHAVLHTAENIAKQQNITLTLLKPDNVGRISLQELESLLADGVPTLVSLMHVNNEIGVINPMVEIGTICRQHGALFHSDTVQSIGHFPLNLANTPVDFIIGAAHKFGGPKGIGFLYVRGGLTIDSLVCGGGQERNRRAGTENVAGIVGMATALTYAQTQHNTNNSQLKNLKNYFWDALQNTFPNIMVNGVVDAQDFAPHILNVSFPGEDIESIILFRLDMEGIAASGGSACTSGSVNHSHVLHALGYSPARCANAVRFSLSHHTTQSEIDRTVQILKKILNT